MNKSVFFLLNILWWAGLSATWAQPLCQIVSYDEDDGLADSHVTQILQDGHGFMWFATWNGLCRYDGYEFLTFKPAEGDGCHMTTHRLRDCALLPDGQIACRTDDTHFIFDTRTYRFRDLTPQEQLSLPAKLFEYRQSRSIRADGQTTWTDAYGTQWVLSGDKTLSYKAKDASEATVYPLSVPMKSSSLGCVDSQGNLWLTGDGAIYKLCTGMQNIQRVWQERPTQVKSLFLDNRNRYWITTRDDRTVRLYDASDDRLLGYLGPDGQLHHGYTAFSSAVYCICQTPDGTIWLGTKPDGIFRLAETYEGHFSVTHHMPPDGNVYNILQDKYQRLWVATLGGGLFYATDLKADVLSFRKPANYPEKEADRVRFLHITRAGVLLAATTEGLLVSALEKNADNMTFRLHQREANRAESLSSGATMDVLEDSRGRLLVSTESGGVNILLNDDPTDAMLRFRHLQVSNHSLANDVVFSLTPLSDSEVLAVSSHLMSIIDSSGTSRVIDARYFNDDLRFSDAHPLRLGNRWLFGLNDGSFFTTATRMALTAPTPHIVLTGLSVQGGADRWDVVSTDTIVLQPHERSFTLRFAAIDHSFAKRIAYSFRLFSGQPADSTKWNNIGYDRSATLLDLHPGTYCMQVRSTNADGQPTDNLRQLTIIVRPTFWESTLGKLVMALILMAIAGVVVYTLLYIKSIKRKQRDTLQAYLDLIKRNAQAPSEAESADDEPETAEPSEPQPAADDTAPPTADDPSLRRVMAYIEENISNSDANVGDMAAASAMSRSGLQRKLKQTMGITPMDLLKEARMAKACHLLRHTDMPVNEVAFACGYADPKYFSRVFKQTKQLSPTDYRNAD